MSIRIVVYGSPAPQGSKAFKGTYKGRDGLIHAKLVEASKKVRPWRQDVKLAAEQVRKALGLAVLDEPLQVRMTFTLPKPLSAPKRRRVFPSKLPDLSKLVRSTEDALTDAGIWRDDARVVECAAAKRYPGEGVDALDAPGCVIEISRVEP
ncbi:TPA: RusA family crossover junction endodeoxyribonuclease [Stenotrophomonas maltophilia]|uniref:RusA family crossover junction endodeoxyribonuclease n=1 Tax=Stenotrophomonas sp. GD03680 TaxID=2975365 RepID=UPI002447429E|nr:RusA family crossover junction endodeoxyribonuclease [Stenotrophomonas sp. GD03680]MDH2023595.1 RusA family crossover junction endodeoxyribonuclease [Stenotrophomonas sp. GD03680]HEL3751342.1 RusA family crossover junction endodeoxyribonuclease [Stenotrophomonas maltophilia]HEL7728670.1 RusA family crossover junction endodeoxyribonuclease [Stenotrophomonas maltophilia]